MKKIGNRKKLFRETGKEKKKRENVYTCKNYFLVDSCRETHHSLSSKGEPLLHVPTFLLIDKYGPNLALNYLATNTLIQKYPKEKKKTKTKENRKYGIFG